MIACLGPTATVLAYDLGMGGLQTLDVGQIDNEYEWYIRNVQERVEIPGKGVSSFAPISLFLTAFGSIITLIRGSTADTPTASNTAPITVITNRTAAHDFCGADSMTLNLSNNGFTFLRLFI